jgi:ABC-type lipoprotein export system ATPase subunit
VMDLLTGLAKQTGTTVVIVTHDARVAAYADRVATVRDGLVTSIDLPPAPATAARVGSAQVGSAQVGSMKGMR